MAPCYIIVAGATAGQGTVITRDRAGQATGHPELKLSDAPLVQPNMDYWDNSAGGDILASRRRRDLARAFFTRHNNVINDPQLLWTLLDTAPILNDITLYTTMMDPARGMISSCIQLYSDI
jgi:hypothetical protein